MTVEEIKELVKKHLSNGAIVGALLPENS